MITVTTPGLPEARAAEVAIDTRNLLSGYEILNASTFSWPVNILGVEFADPTHQAHENRGDVKDII